VVRSIDGRTLLGITELVEHIRARPGQPIDLQVKRLDEVLRVTVTPEDNGGTGQIGVRLGYTGEYKKYGPVRAVVESARYNWNLVRQIGELVGKLASGRLSARGSLAGPIEIAAQSGDAARRGAADLIHFIAFISINIGLLNLMPIPILDGGQILILLIESTMRRDLPLRAKEIISQVGFVLILLLMLMVIWFDVSRRLLPG
jgi:regulator of sigma E protease